MSAKPAGVAAATTSPEDSQAPVAGVIETAAAAASTPRGKRPTGGDPQAISQVWFEDDEDAPARGDRARRTASPSATDLTFDEEPPRRRRWGLIIAGLAVLLGGGIALAMTLGGGSRPKQPEQSATAPAAAPAAPPSTFIDTPEAAPEPEAAPAVAPPTAPAAARSDRKPTAPASGADLAHADLASLRLRRPHVRTAARHRLPPSRRRWRRHRPAAHADAHPRRIPAPRASAARTSRKIHTAAPPRLPAAPAAAAPRSRPSSTRTSAGSSSPGATARTRPPATRRRSSFDPRSVAATIGMGEVALRAGLFGDAIAHLQKASRLAPRSARIQVLTGEAYLSLGRNQDAAAAFKKALQLEPDNARARDGYNEASSRVPPADE